MAQQPRFLKVLLFIQLGIIFLLAWPVWFNTYTPVSFILTYSMTPTLPPGTIIFVRRDASPGLRQYENQPIVFYDALKKMSICHRVIGIEGNRLVTKGDNNPFADSFRPGEENILGRVIFALTIESLCRLGALVLGVVLVVLFFARRPRRTGR